MEGAAGAVLGQSGAWSGNSLKSIRSASGSGAGEGSARANRRKTRVPSVKGAHARRGKGAFQSARASEPGALFGENRREGRLLAAPGASPNASRRRECVQAVERATKRCDLPGRGRRAFPRVPKGPRASPGQGGADRLTAQFLNAPSCGKNGAPFGWRARIAADRSGERPSWTMESRKREGTRLREQALRARRAAQTNRACRANEAHRALPRRL